jgi:hypothetical protein
VRRHNSSPPIRRDDRGVCCDKCCICGTTGKSAKICLALSPKIFRFSEIIIRAITLPARASMRGRLRNRHGTLARVAMDAVASGGISRRTRTRRVRRNRVVLAPRPWRQVGAKYRAGDGGKTGRSPGRARISRKAIARGKPGCLGCTCQIRVRSCLPIAHGAAGAVGARLSLRPLSERGTMRLHSSGENRAAGTLLAV